MGCLKLNIKPLNNSKTPTYTRIIGLRQYELSNHLGNVLTTVSDCKSIISDGTTLTYEAVVLSATDYDPFGFGMPHRTFNGDGYRFGFNGKETDSETDLQDYGFRIYNPALGKFLSVDPLTRKFPWYTPYQFAGNMPICAIDLEGLEYKIVILRYTTGKQRPEIEVYRMQDVVFDATTLEPESKVDGEMQVALTETWFYYDGVYTKTEKIYEPEIYPGGLKPSASYDYSTKKGLKELYKDNKEYLKKNGADVFKSFYDIYTRDGLALDNEDVEGFHNILEASIYVIPYPKHRYVKSKTY